MGHFFYIMYIILSPIANSLLFSKVQITCFKLISSYSSISGQCNRERTVNFSIFQPALGMPGSFHISIIYQVSCFHFLACSRANNCLFTSCLILVNLALISASSSLFANLLEVAIGSS